MKTQEDGSSRLTVAFSQIPEGEYLNGTVHVTFSLGKYLQEGTEHTCFFALSGSQTEKLYQMVCREQSQKEMTEPENLPGEESERESSTEADTEEATVLLEAEPENTEDVDEVEPETLGENGNAAVVTGTFNISGHNYNATTPITILIADPTNITATVGTLTLELKHQMLALQPTVVPADSTDASVFVMKATFTNSRLSGSGEAERMLDMAYQLSKSNSATIQVPIGISYRVTQQTPDGYRFDENYSTITKTGETESAPFLSEGSATGIITEGTDVTVSTVNYAQNYSVGFDVNWLDNHKAARPELSEKNFILQYKTADGKWKEVTKDDPVLNLEKDPVFDKLKAALNQYSYTGLPAVDADGNQLEYQVIVREDPVGYVSDYTDGQDGRRIFTFEEQTSFSAQIVWNDAHGESHRPEINSENNSLKDKLKLYRRIENGKYELVYDQLPEGALSAETESNIWSVTVSDLCDPAPGGCLESVEQFKVPQNKQKSCMRNWR